MHCDGEKSLQECLDPEVCEAPPHTSGPARPLPGRRASRHGTAEALDTAAAIPLSCQ
jgi:hypothetical protein